MAPPGLASGSLKKRRGIGAFAGYGTFPNMIAST
jgi:hypothetical protein